MAAPPKYNPKFHIPWGFSLACDGKTDEEIAEAMRVSERTINRWKFLYDENGKPILDENGEKKLSPFGEELFRGKAIADSQVEQSLFKSCLGYTIEEKEELVEVGRDGRPKPLKVRKTTKHVPANVMAQMYWLNNRSRRSGKWSQRQDVTLRTSTDAELSNLSEEELRKLASLATLPDQI